VKSVHLYVVGAFLTAAAFGLIVVEKVTGKEIGYTFVLLMLMVAAYIFANELEKKEDRQFREDLVKRLTKWTMGAIDALTQLEELSGLDSEVYGTHSWKAKNIDELYIEVAQCDGTITKYLISELGKKDINGHVAYYAEGKVAFLFPDGEDETELTYIL
jgi:hypothetical protein